MTGNDGVILLHGLARTARSLRWFSRRLHEHGFEVAALDYPSCEMTVEAAGLVIAGQVRERFSHWRRIHLLGHSLGGVVALHARHTAPDLPWGRSVLLGAPNHGSALANAVMRIPPMRRRLGPALSQIRKNEAPLPEQVGDGVGAIAGSVLWAPLARLYGVASPSDGMVTVASACAVTGAKAVVLPVDHAFMILNQGVVNATAAFLREGRFDASAEKSRR